MQETKMTDIFSLPQFDPTKLLDVQYLLEPQPASFAFSGLLILGLVLVLVVASLFKFLLRKGYLTLIGPRKVILNKATKFNIIMSLIGLTLAFIRIVGVTYVSMRVLMLIFLVLMFGINLYFLIRYITTKNVLVEVEEGPKGTKNYQEYLPKKKYKRKK